MVRQIAPLFFTMDIPATLAYYKEKLGFECLGTWQDPPVYAIVARARVRGEGLRWPSAGFRSEPVVFSGGPSRRPTYG
jgi:hypothetical protein